MKHSAQTIETSVTPVTGTDAAHSPSTPFQVFYGSERRRHDTRPVCFRESLETALHAIPFVGWWEVRDRSERVVASCSIGIQLELVPRPSLLARQILSTLRMVGKARESVGEIEIDTGAWTGTEVTVDGHDALLGEVEVVWTRLSEMPDRPRSNGAAGARPKTRGALPPVSFEAAPHPAVSVTIRHSTGWMSVKDHRFLELRAQTKLDRDGMPRWDLVILNVTESGEPGRTAKGTAVEGLGLEEFLELGGIGVAVREVRDPSAPPKTWKSGMVTTRIEGESGSGEQIEYPGWVRGCYGIDKRSVEMQGCGGFGYHQARYHLTHLPSGYLVMHCKRKSTAERVADMLVEEVPEMGGEQPPSALTRHRVRELLQYMRDAAGWQWDR